ncbi:hypothetical protein SOM22_09310 [Stenotrophomonas rhizophila]|uniref:hypothetical protein n=1 Tax=Stenotrophomonas rhizophila TaxID=216778 RepID=UPI002A6B5479|nr:hypothetical protein [Stenotrophomonas rhizophila]MDY0954774.1 hypothetical protein [Stenotrophomonas rhizophila]
MLTNVAADGNRGASRCGRADRWSAAVQSPQEQPTNGRLYRDTARRDPHTECGAVPTNVAADGNRGSVQMR